MKVFRSAKAKQPKQKGKKEKGRGEGMRIKRSPGRPTCRYVRTPCFSSHGATSLTWVSLQCLPDSSCVRSAFFVMSVSSHTLRSCDALRYRLAEQRLVDGGGSYGYMGWEIGLDFVILFLAGRLGSCRSEYQRTRTLSIECGSRASIYT